MLRRFLDSRVRKASWRQVLVCALLFAVSYSVINFSEIGQAGLLRLTGGANMLDVLFGYTCQEAYDALTALGAEGRAFYLTRIAPQDILLPFLYMLFFASTITLLLKHTTPERVAGIGKYLLPLPVLAMLFDWSENIGTVTLTISYPSLPEWAVHLASVSGILKTVWTTACLAVIVLLCALYAASKITKKLHERRFN